MHPNPAFRRPDDAQNLAFARQRGFGNLALNGPEGPIISHIPFVIAEDDKTLLAHLVASNPIVKMLDNDQPAMIAINGPDAYISPDWYGMDDQVPTWNYVAVHLRGTLQRLSGDALPDILRQLSATFESRLAPKELWTQDKMNPKALQGMLRAITPVALDITSINGTWKLSQNKPDFALGGVVDALSAVGQDAMATLVKTKQNRVD